MVRLLPGYKHDTTWGVDKKISLESSRIEKMEYVTGDIIIKSSMRLLNIIFFHSAITSSVLDSNIRIKSISQILTFSPIHPSSQIADTCKTKVKIQMSLSLYPTGLLFKLWSVI